MNNLIIYILISLLSVKSCIAHDGGFIDEDLDIKRYNDLWNDKRSQKFLKIILDLTYGHARYISPEEWEDIRWARREDFSSVLLEVLRREPNDQESNSASEWLGVSRKGYAIEWALAHEAGDLEIFVEEVRKQLPYWLDRKIKSGMNSIFIKESLELLSTKGDASDIPLIEGFLEDPNGNNRHYAEKNLEALKERLASELSQNRKDRVVRGERDSTISATATANSKDTNPSSLQSDSVEGQKSPILWYILSALGVVLLLTFLKTWKRNSK